MKGRHDGSLPQFEACAAMLAASSERPASLAADRFETVLAPLPFFIESAALALARWSSGLRRAIDHINAALLEPGARQQTSLSACPGVLMRWSIAIIAVLSCRPASWAAACRALRRRGPAPSRLAVRHGF
jgi:hypothetical protein